MRENEINIFIVKQDILRHVPQISKHYFISELTSILQIYKCIVVQKFEYQIEIYFAQTCIPPKLGFISSA